MKKILLFIFIYPTILLASHAEVFHEREVEKNLDNKEVKKQLVKEKIKNPVQKLTNIPPKSNVAETKTDSQTKQEPPKTSINLNPKEFSRQDALLKLQRETEDRQRQERWKLEDQKEQESRKEQSFFERAFNKMSGVHSTAEEEKNAVRSKNLFETNKARMQEDFKRQSQRFDDFADKHTEFQSGDGQTLLQLGKMDKFIEMNKEERTKALENITDIVNNRLENFSVEAMQDLVQLAHLSRTGEQLPAEFDALVNLEISPDNTEAVKKALIEFLKSSMNESLKSMKAYSDAIDSESIQDSIKDLASTRRVKNFANNGTMILGCAGLAVMVVPGVSHIASAIHLTAERLFIGAKALFLGAHASGGAEGHFERTLQDKYVDAFKHLLPKSTELLKTDIIKTMEKKGLFQQAKDWFKDKSEKVDKSIEKSAAGETYKKVKSGLQKASNKAKSIAKSVADSDFGKKTNDIIKSASEGLSDFAKKQFRKIGTEKAQQEITKEFNLGIKFSDEEEKKITEEEIAKAEIQSKINSLQDKINEHKKSNATTFDIDLYKMEDELVTHQRAQEDLLRKLDWQKEDGAAAEQRNKQNISERMLKGASTDAGIDKEKENVRNKEIIELNRKRMQEDFETKAKRFTTFVENNPDFAAKKPWNEILKLGDMNTFTTMTPEARKELLDSIEKSMNDFFADESQTFDDKDMASAKQLISLTNLYRPSNITLPENIAQALQSETESANQDATKKALKEFFKNSTQATLATLQEFSKNLDVNMNSLEKIRTAKAVSFGSIMIVGIAGVAVMVTGHPLVFDKVKITLEQCAIVGKAALLGAHVSSHEEKDIVRVIQDQYTKTFQALLPESTKLIESIKYENKSQSLRQRAKETKAGGLIHKHIIKPIIDAAKKAGNAVADLHEKHTKSYTDAAIAKIKSAGTTIATGAKNFHEKYTKPLTDAVSNNAQKVYKKSGLKDYVDKKNAAKRDKLQNQFTLTPNKSNPPDSIKNDQKNKANSAAVNPGIAAVS